MKVTEKKVSGTATFIIEEIQDSDIGKNLNVSDYPGVFIVTPEYVKRRVSTVYLDGKHISSTIIHEFEKD